jgi:hypothetical protein
MDTNLSPCRASVLDFDYMRGRFSDDWVAPRVVLASDAVLEANRATVAAFTAALPFVDDQGDQRRTDVQRHQVCERIPLRRAMEELLVQLRITGITDSQRNTGLLLQFSKALEEDEVEECAVYRMSPARKRLRGIDASGEVTNLFQGEAPVFPKERRGEVYPGDRAIRDPGRVSIQIHLLDLTRDDRVVVENVPVVAVWVPARLARAWVAQEPQVQP